MPAQSPEEVDVLFEKYLNAGDLDGLVALYEAGATLIPSPGEAATGSAAIRESLAAFVGMKPVIDLKVQRSIVNGDIAVLFSDWTMTGGGQEMAGKTVEVVRRQADGSWRFVIDDPYARG